MIDHVSVAVRDLGKAQAFYTAVLAPLGFAKLREWPDAAVGFGKKHPEFWLNKRSAMEEVAPDSGVQSACARRTPPRSTLSTPRRSKPAARPTARPDCGRNITPRYYAAFIRDPDGNRIEAVTFVREGAE